MGKASPTTRVTTSTTAEPMRPRRRCSNPRCRLGYAHSGPCDVSELVYEEDETIQYAHDHPGGPGMAVPAFVLRNMLAELIERREQDASRSSRSSSEEPPDSTGER